MGNGIIFFQLLNTTKEWLNRAHVAHCQRAQKPWIKNSKKSNHRQHWCQPTTWFLSASVALYHNYFHKNSELVVSPCKDVAIENSLQLHFYMGFQKTGNGFILLQLLNMTKEWLKRARIPRCQKIRKRQIFGNANANLPPDFCHHQAR